jgi:hypothetical protein
MPAGGGISVITSFDAEPYYPLSPFFRLKLFKEFRGRSRRCGAPLRLRHLDWHKRSEVSAVSRPGS